MRKEFELTQEQYDELMVASQPVPYIIAGGLEPTSQQESANRAWERLGKELGFEYMTARPVPGKGALFFTAEVTGG